MQAICNLSKNVPNTMEKLESLSESVIYSDLRFYCDEKDSESVAVELKAEFFNICVQAIYTDNSQVILLNRL